MNGKIKFHKATGPAFNVGEVWVSVTGVKVEIVSVSKYPGAIEDHTDDYSVTYRNTVDGSIHEKDAWNFQVRYTHHGISLCNEDKEHTMTERIDELAFEAGCHRHKYWDPKHPDLEGFIISQAVLDKFAELIVAECIDKIETYRIPVGNSAAGEMACEWTYAALKEIRDEIKEHFGVEE